MRTSLVAVLIWRQQTQIDTHLHTYTHKYTNTHCYYVINIMLHITYFFMLIYDSRRVKGLAPLLVYRHEFHIKLIAVRLFCGCTLIPFGYCIFCSCMHQLHSYHFLLCFIIYNLIFHRSPICSIFLLLPPSWHILFHFLPSVRHCRSNLGTLCCSTHHHPMSLSYALTLTNSVKTCNFYWDITALVAPLLPYLHVS